MWYNREHFKNKWQGSWFAYISPKSLFERKKKMASQSISPCAWAPNFDGLCLVLETQQTNGFHCSNNTIVLHKTTNKKNPKTHITISGKIKLVTNHWGTKYQHLVCPDVTVTLSVLMWPWSCLSWWDCVYYRKNHSGWNTQIYFLPRFYRELIVSLPCMQKKKTIQD